MAHRNCSRVHCTSSMSPVQKSPHSPTIIHRGNERKWSKPASFVSHFFLFHAHGSKTLEHSIIPIGQQKGEFQVADHHALPWEGTHLVAVAVRAVHVHGLDVERVHPPRPLPEPPPEPAGGHPRRYDARRGVLGRPPLVLEGPLRGLGRVDLAAVYPARAPRPRRRQEPRRRRLLLDPAVVHRGSG
jgi:hypothetical protein